MDNYTTYFADRYNLLVGSAVAILAAVFGKYWYLFAGFLILNFFDWITGWQKANKKHEESSRVGLQGIVKKLGLWVVVMVAFMISGTLQGIGADLLHKDLSFLQALGWLTLSMLFVNEARSIIENEVELGANVPAFLIRGLAITQKLIEAGAKIPDYIKEEINAGDD